MHLSSARELKQVLLEKSRRRYAETRVYEIRAVGKSVSLEQHAPVAALGVAPNPARKRDYRVAVRIFAGKERQAADLMRSAQRYAREMDVARGVVYRPRAKPATVRAGGSCGHYAITAGTLGGFVEDDDNYYMLSNNHVLANSDRGQRGDPILEPGPADIRGRYLVIGHLSRWRQLSTNDAQGVDAALAVFSDRVGFFEPWDYRGVGRMQTSPVGDRYSVTEVVKTGRTTGITVGTVSAFELDGVRINYGTPQNPRIVTFDDQIEIVGSPIERPFSQPGDSGSFVLERGSLRAYALLYGGGPDAQGIDRTVAHFMESVLRSLGVRLVQ
jgi:hypothetical protein